MENFVSLFGKNPFLWVVPLPPKHFGVSPGPNFEYIPETPRKESELDLSKLEALTPT